VHGFRQDSRGMDSRGEAQRRWTALGVGAVGLFGLLAARLSAVPVAEWGSNGSAWSEHAGRLRWLIALRDNGQADEPLGAAGLLAEMESGFPSGLYLAGAWAEPLVGPTAEAVAWLGLLWLVPLALGVGAVAAALGGRSSLLPVGALATLLAAPFAASALRFYFDLPMTSMVWLSAGLLATWTGWRGGLAAGLVGVVACVIKWTALPFVLPIWLGIVLCRREGWTGAAVATGTLAVGVGSYLMAVGPDNSLMAMAGEASVGGGGVGGLISDSLTGLFSLQGEPVARLLFYAGSTLFGVLSPLGAVVLGAGLWAAWKHDRVGLPLLAVTALGHAAVLMMLVRPVDERFVLTGLPAAIVVAVLGWQALEAVGRKRLGAVALIGMGLVAADLHLGGPLGQPSWDLRPIDGGGPVASQPIQVRGPGLASSFQGRGWWRRDEVPKVRAGLREAVFERLLAGGAESVRAPNDGPLVQPEGDQMWFAYRGGLEQWTTGQAAFGLQANDCEDDPSGPGLRWVTPVSGAIVAPDCPRDAQWKLLEVVADPDGGDGVAIWTVRGPTEP
jgi:hypothetical protein